MLCSLVLLSVLLTSYKSRQDQDAWNDETTVVSVLLDLNEPLPIHYRGTASAEEIERGRQFIHEGKTTSATGKKSKYISKHFMCTSCHNTVREDENLKVVDQDARLKYAQENDLGYLQGSTFWGIVNREIWYNDDYFKKYGKLVEPARESLVESIQLCATSCAQGRSLEDWEVEAILAYYTSLQVKMGDLNLSKSEWNRLRILASRPNTYSEAVKLIKSKYALKSPATFVDPPHDKKAGYGLKGRPEMGKIIFNKGCQHCHRAMGESEVVLENNKESFQWLKRHMFDNSKLSMYEIVRHGTYAEFGHRPYMPHYTQEKMSDQQLEDLRAYIEQQLAL